MVFVVLHYKIKENLKTDMCKQVIPYSKQYKLQDGTYKSEMHEENSEESVPSCIMAGGSDAVKILPNCVAAHWQGLQFYT